MFCCLWLLVCVSEKLNVENRNAGKMSNGKDKASVRTVDSEMRLDHLSKRLEGRMIEEKYGLEVLLDGREWQQNLLAVGYLHTV